MFPPRSVAHRAVLALDAGAVEAQGGHAVDHTLDAEDTLVATLARLGLGQVSGLQRDGFHLSHRDQDLLGGEELRTVLGGQEKRGGGYGGDGVSAGLARSQRSSRPTSCFSFNPTAG